MASISSSRWQAGSNASSRAALVGAATQQLAVLAGGSGSGRWEAAARQGAVKSSSSWSTADASTTARSSRDHGRARSWRGGHTRGQAQGMARARASGQGRTWMRPYTGEHARTRSFGHGDHARGATVNGVNQDRGRGESKEELTTRRMESSGRRGVVRGRGNPRQMATAVRGEDSRWRRTGPS